MSDSFKFWSSYWDAAKELSMEQRGQFLTALCSYVFEDTDVDGIDPIVRFGYMAVRGSAIESRDISRAARENGKSGGRGNKKPHEKGGKSTPLSTPLSGAKSGGKSTPKSPPLSTPLSPPLSGAKAYSSVGTVGSYATSSGSSYAAGASRAAAASVGGSAPQDQPQPAAYDDEMVRLYGPLHGALGET